MNRLKTFCKSEVRNCGRIFKNLSKNSLFPVRTKDFFKFSHVDSISLPGMS